MTILVVLVACTEPAETIEPQITSNVEIKRIPLAKTRELDVLIVVDNTPAMAPYADALGTNLRALAEQLRPFDLQLAVVTAAPADAGEWRGTAGLDGDFLFDRVGPDGERRTNYTGDLTDVIVRLGEVGVQGGASSPLVRARSAFRHATGNGFRRARAYAAIFVITANDLPDEDLTAYAAFFKSLHVDPSKVIVGGVYGPGERLPAFLELFPYRFGRAAIGDPDWSRAFALVRELAGSWSFNLCIEGTLLDADPIAPGSQPACTAWYQFPAGGAVVPPCLAAPERECWRLVEDLARCPERDHLWFALEHKRVDLPEGAMLNSECSTTTRQL